MNIPCHLKCLPADARVQTADGERAIATLTAGELVYTTDCDGRRRLVTIERVSRTPVDATAKILALTLADGRVVRGSPGHPTATGARLDALVAGATLDGSEVVHIQNVPLLGDATYDILPFGPTGTFWADGVLLGSTLAKPSCLVRGDRARAPSRPNH